MRRVDAHVHGFPDRLAVAVRESLNRNGSLTGSPLLPALSQSVLDGGLSSAWVLPYAHREGVAESINEWSARELAPIPWLVAGATFHPADAGLDRLVERALVEVGLRVVKLHCSVGGYSPSDSRLEPLWRMASRLGVPVVVHAGQASPGDTSAAEVGEIEPVLAAYPELPLVLAHAGHPGTARTLELMARYPRLYADLTPVWDRHVAVEAEDLARFPDRFLFGSDAPNSPLPRSGQQQRIERMDLPAPVLESILGGAAENLQAIQGVRTSP